MKTKLLVLMVAFFSLQIIAQTKQDSINQLKNILDVGLRFEFKE